MKLCQRCQERRSIHCFTERGRICSTCREATVKKGRARREAELGIEEVRRLNREAVRRIRATPEGRAKQRAYSVARNRAVQDLINRHPVEFMELMSHHRDMVEAQRVAPVVLLRPDPDDSGSGGGDPNEEGGQA